MVGGARVRLEKSSCCLDCDSNALDGSLLMFRNAGHSVSSPVHAV